MEGSPKIIDLKYLEGMTGGSPELVREMIDIFIAQVPEFITDMKDLYGKKEWESLGGIAHKAKSSVAIMGMNDLAQQLKDFEMAALNGVNKESYETYISDFEEVCTRAIDELKKIKENI